MSLFSIRILPAATYLCTLKGRFTLASNWVLTDNINQAKKRIRKPFIRPYRY